jgi:hypothetical protein
MVHASSGHCAAGRKYHVTENRRIGLDTPLRRRQGDGRPRSRRPRPPRPEMCCGNRSNTPYWSRTAGPRPDRGSEPRRRRSCMRPRDRSSSTISASVRGRWPTLTFSPAYWRIVACRRIRDCTGRASSRARSPESGRSTCRYPSTTCSRRTETPIGGYVAWSLRRSSRAGSTR